MLRHLIVDPNDARCGQPVPDDELDAAQKRSRERAAQRERELWRGRARVRAKEQMLDLAAAPIAKEAGNQK